MNVKIAVTVDDDPERRFGGMIEADGPETARDHLVEALEALVAYVRNGHADTELGLKPA